MKAPFVFGCALFIAGSICGFLGARLASNAAALGVVSEWAVQDTQSAAAWIGQFPDPELQTSAAVNLMSRWAGVDPESAAQWLSALPAGKAGDQAAITYGNSSHDNPAAALQAAALISEESSRLHSVQNAASRWLEQDQKAALEWIQNANLPAETRDHLLRHVTAE